MHLLKDAIIKYGKVLAGDILQVGSFLNQQIDVELIDEIAKTIYDNFKDCAVNKIMTIESSGISLACATARFFNCKVVVAKKGKASNVSGDCYTAKCYSYTHGKTEDVIVSKQFLSASDNVLFVDDFLAKGSAMDIAIDVTSQAGANLVGMAVAVEKGFQGAGDKLRSEGYKLLSVAIVDSMQDGKITFRN